MALFAYVGRTREGVIQRGELVAKDQREAVRLLRRQRVAVTRLREKATWNVAWPTFLMGSRMRGKDLVVFTLQFATMLKAGIPLVQCLEVLGTHSENPTLRKTLEDVRHDVESGASYAAAIQKHPKVFSDFYVSLMEAGEAGGILDTILTRLAKHLEKTGELKNRITTAMAYPATILAVAVVVLMFLLIWVIPTFAHMFREFGGVLPWPTVLVIESSQFLQDHMLSLLVLVGVLGYGLRYGYGTTRGRRLLDRLLLRLPLVGDLLRKAAVAHFTRTLGSLMTSGVPILEGLNIAAKTSGNVVVEEAIRAARVSISEGEAVAEPLANSGIFPKMVTQMITVGESTGSLDSMLEKIADLYENEVNQALTTMTSLVEPFIIIVLGLGIGFIVVAMYLPIFNISSVLG